MSRAYKVIDADGHILEPLDLWDHYMERKFRDQAPRLIVDTDGKERLLISGKVLGSKKGIGIVGAIGARDGVVSDDKRNGCQKRRRYSPPGVPRATSVSGLLSGGAGRL